MISWPSAADYDEAIQNPHLNFIDPELKGGEPVFDDYGSPEVRSGNFASVYMLRTTSRTVAVRCFLREVADSQERYAAISHDLLGLGLPYTVDFEFLPKGIKVNDNWFPALKMDWCNGELLDDYIKRNLDNPVKLRRLSDKWYEMSVALRKEGIAHGDLQHGNIFVLEDELKLIDYDGMFVPRLAGRKSNERGLEHYQHPKRTDQHFGRYLDNFSNWLIFTTLFALAEDKSLWRFVNIEDKHLIFSKKDLEKPDQSEIFSVLKKHDDKTIRTFAITIENLLQYEVDKVPDFSPDRPVLYPPSMYQAPAPAPAKRLADKSVTFTPINEDKLKLLEAQKGGDRGNLYGDRDGGGGGGDRGRLYDTASSDKGGTSGGGDRGNLNQAGGGDRGNLHSQDRGGDRGNLMEAQKGDRGNLASPAKPGLSKDTIILGGAVAIILAVVGGVTVWYLQTLGGYHAMLKEGVISASLRDPDFPTARKKFKAVMDDTSLAGDVRSKAACMLALTYIKHAGESGIAADRKDALDNLKQAKDFDKDNVIPYLIESKLYQSTGEKQAAEQAFQEADRRDPKTSRDFKRQIGLN